MNNLLSGDFITNVVVILFFVLGVLFFLFLPILAKNNPIKVRQEGMEKKISQKAFDDIPESVG